MKQKFCILTWNYFLYKQETKLGGFVKTQLI